MSSPAFKEFIKTPKGKLVLALGAMLLSWIFLFLNFAGSSSIALPSEARKAELMSQNESKDGVIFKMKNDPRITKVGKVIRALRIDELPQLLNIIKGDMSIVGPRPERVEHCKMYGEQIPEFEFRNKVKGGLTGYAQVYGKYNTTALDKLRLDLMYIENYSFALDIKIILMTVRILFKKESTEGFEE